MDSAGDAQVAIMEARCQAFDTSYAVDGMFAVTLEAGTSFDAKAGADLGASFVLLQTATYNCGAWTALDKGCMRSDGQPEQQNITVHLEERLAPGGGTLPPMFRAGVSAEAATKPLVGATLSAATTRVDCTR
jgi:hypothetical protein